MRGFVAISPRKAVPALSPERDGLPLRSCVPLKKKFYKSSAVYCTSNLPTCENVVPGGLLYIDTLTLPRRRGLPGTKLASRFSSWYKIRVLFLVYVARICLFRRGYGFNVWVCRYLPHVVGSPDSSNNCFYQRPGRANVKKQLLLQVNSLSLQLCTAL